MSAFAKTPIGGESDRFEVDVELLVGDDFVGVAALVVGVDVGGGTVSASSAAVATGVDGGREGRTGARVRRGDGAAMGSGTYLCSVY